MTLLVIDTAGPDCAAGLFDDAGKTPLSRISERIGKGHAERLPAMIESVMAEAGAPLSSIRRIGVTIGPGSFTGIRVGVSYARGLALALSVPVVGIVTLDVLAEADGRRPLAVVMDARRGEVYLRLYGAGGPDGPAALVSLDAARAQLAQSDRPLIGSGLAALSGNASVPDSFPLDALASLSALADDGKVAAPLYLRNADAKPQTGFAVARR